MVNAWTAPPVHTYDELPDWIVNYFEPTLFWISVGLLVIVSFIFFQHFRKVEVGKPFSFGLLAFSVCFLVARTLENIRKFYMASSRLNIVEGWVGQGDIISGTELNVRIFYYIFSWAAISTFYFVTEKHVFQKKTKYVFMISAILEGLLSIALYFTEGNVRIWVQIFATIFFFLCAVAPIILYFSMAFKASGILRFSSFIAAFGFTFFVLGVLGELPESQFVVYLVSGQFLDAYMIAIFSPVSMMIGLILMVVGYNKMFSGLF